MEFVQPIRDEKKIQKMKKYLRGRNIRDYVLFTVGINSGLRISDLLALRVEDVKGKDRVSIREGKTSKTKDFPLSDSCKKVIAEYILERGLVTGPLFPSRKGGTPLKRVQAWTILNEAARVVGIDERIGTHTLRKTFAYHAFKRGHDVTIIQKLLNHAAPSVTLAYIGIQRDELDSVYLNLNL